MSVSPLVRTQVVKIHEYSHPCYSSMPVIHASHICQSSMPVIHASHPFQSSMPVIQASHPCHSSMLLIHVSRDPLHPPISSLYLQFSVTAISIHNATLALLSCHFRKIATFSACLLSVCLIYLDFLTDN